MQVHKENIDAEVRVWSLRQELDERERNVQWRTFVSQELADAKEERRLLTDEQRLRKEERQQSTEAQDKISILLREVEDAKRRLEERRLGKSLLGSKRTDQEDTDNFIPKDDTVCRIQSWLGAASSSEFRECTSNLKEPNTGKWIFDHPRYTSWIKGESVGLKPVKRRKFGPQMLWVHGELKTEAIRGRIEVILTEMERPSWIRQDRPRHISS